MRKISTIAIAILLSSTTIDANEPDRRSDALVSVATACIRSMPSHAAEMVSQVVMGTPIHLYEYTDGWWHIETPEGYNGYIISNALQAVDSTEITRWRQAPRVMYTSSYTGRLYSTTESGQPVSDIHSGSVLEVIGYTTPDSIDIILPDKRLARIAAEHTTPLESFGTSSPDTQAILDMARSLMGVSYLWGGTTTTGMDCSGFTKVCYLNQGIIIQRDAGQQAITGRFLPPDYTQFQQGDLVFFKNADTGRINHVGIYDHDGLYIHCSGRVKVNSLNPDSELYIPDNILASGTRIMGQLNTEGITLITSSPYYFNVD